MLLTMSFEQYIAFTWIWIAIAVPVFILLFFVTAPYGRHTKKTWGPLINNKLGWFIMEFFLLVIFFYFILTGENEQSLVNMIIIGLITLHYLDRSLLFPFRIKTKGKKMPVAIMFMALGFNLSNGYLFGYYLGNFKVYTMDWLTTPQFIIGSIVFVTGAVINKHADTVLINLRKPNETGYKIPQGGLFKYISCPNLFGEVIEWLGFAILTWSLPGLAFFVWTFANLVPRALSHHKWYLNNFEDYPEKRKAVIPFVW